VYGNTEKQKHFKRPCGGITLRVNSAGAIVMNALATATLRVND